MSSPLVAALIGRCPACREGRVYAGFLTTHELCPRCGVRFERYVSTRTVGTALAFLVAAGLLFGADQFFRRVSDSPALIVGVLVALGAVLYPVLRNVALFVLWHNGLVTVDVPEEPRARRSDRGGLDGAGRPGGERAALDPAAPVEPFGPPVRPIVALPPEDPTIDEPRRPLDDDPTDEENRA